jgi:hypothetical protein
LAERRFRRTPGESGSPQDVSPDDNPTNEPEPDIIVLKADSSRFTQNPRPEDLHLVVEIADSTLSFDLNTNARLYARASIVAYWVLDISGRRMDRPSRPPATAVTSRSSPIASRKASPVSPRRNPSSASATPFPNSPTEKKKVPSDPIHNPAHCRHARP